MSEHDRRQPPTTPDTPHDATPLTTPVTDSVTTPATAFATDSNTGNQALVDCQSEHFDALYGAHAGPLIRQALLLTGRARLARRAVERAFQTAWQRWPEVVADPDPVGWVRAAAYEYALAPWRRLFPGLRPTERPGPGTPAPPPAAPEDHALLTAVLALPVPYRRALLLHDGVGLGLHETAAEVEATTPAATGRLTHARECLAERLPELGLKGLPPDRQGAVLHARLGALAALRPVVVPPAREVRTEAERRARLTTRTGFGAAGLLAVAALAVSLSTPDGYRPPPRRPAVAAPSSAPGPAAQQADRPQRSGPKSGHGGREAGHHARRDRALPNGARLTPDAR
ncbi:hypothetical protein [Streptomyces sp. BHT-5-2]|uniref:hypothetical protein n=1 Tax=Streptomyces sp. BHT-5-2 TaxID=2866715 RepID=UPI0021B146CD|nr:hypothetical protein [Streptomyces sp. BHT-5-2]